MHGLGEQKPLWRRKINIETGGHSVPEKNVSLKNVITVVLIANLCRQRGAAVTAAWRKDLLWVRIALWDVGAGQTVTVGKNTLIAKCHKC
jgi:hypothetical protein